VYTPNDQHRNAQFAAQKSQWTIPVADETLCYTHANAQGWCGADKGWGLHLSAAGPAQLGVSPQQFHLFIAKFVQDQNVWHGYPVAHWLSPFDKPSADTLKAWEDRGLINRATKAKIYRGKKCSL
jgi:hypothetical protein